MRKNTNQLSGFLIINKPAGLTSHNVVAHVRRLIKVGLPAEALAKVGHAGTLDPFATGVLLVGVGNTTRLLEYAKDFSKTYEVEITLGASSDTDDLTGTITPRTGNTPGVELDSSPGVKEVQKALNSFLGPIQQIPPAYAAIKVKGKKLYEYARAGESVIRKPRAVTIHSIKLISYKYPLIRADISCGSGTYIRSLARDIGEKLGTGGYVSYLERKNIHKFHISGAVALSKLSTANLTTPLLPPERLIEHFPPITLSPDNVAKFVRGQGIHLIRPPGSVDFSFVRRSASPYEGEAGRKAGEVLSPIATFDQNQSLIGISSFDSKNSLLYPKKVL